MRWQPRRLFIGTSIKIRRLPDDKNEASLQMKRLYLTLFTVALLCYLASAQKTILVRDFPMQFLNRDSVIAYYNENYFLIEDSCAAIVRRGFFNDSMGKFTGPFEDRSKKNVKQVIARGTYNKRGLKEGEFTSWYLNGKLQARGNFKADRYDGAWDFYSASGKPRLSFEATDGGIVILDSWDEDGHKLVKNGTGKHEVDAGAIVWSGKVINGKKHGTWTAAVRPFKPGYISNTYQPKVLATEIFDNGIFKQGSNPTGTYRDSSRMTALPAVPLPLLNAEQLALTLRPCNDRYGKIVIYAYHPKGYQDFTSKVRERLTPLLASADTTVFKQSMELQFIISKEGIITNDASVSSDTKLMADLKAILQGFREFVPATINGKAVEQGIKIVIAYHHGHYFFNYVLMPFEEL